MREQFGGIEVDKRVEGRDADDLFGLGFGRPAGTRLKEPARAVMVELPFAHVSRPGKEGMGK